MILIDESEIVVIPALPGWFALSAYLDVGNRLCITKCHVIAWRIHTTIDEKGDPSSFTEAIAPDCSEDYPALVDPSGRVFEEGNISCETLEDYLEYKNNEKGVGR